jgi:large subunit ribosomal protein L4e
MFAPTKTFRKWTKKVNVKIRKLAVRAALAASAIPALVMARGHNIEDVPEIPLVVPNSIETLHKTRYAVQLLKQMGLAPDLQRVLDSRRARTGKGKQRTHRYRHGKGPLVIVNKLTCKRGFRNIMGIDVINVRHMNLLLLCPGGHVGRMIIWSEDAFKKLEKLYPMDPGHVVDSKRVINSEEVQGVLRKKIPKPKKQRKTAKRPVLNPAAKLNSKIARRNQKKATALNKNLKKKLAVVKAKKLKKIKFVNSVMSKVPGWVCPPKYDLERKAALKQKEKIRLTVNAERRALRKALKEAGKPLEKVTLKTRTDARKAAAKAAGLVIPPPLRGPKREKAPKKE